MVVVHLPEEVGTFCIRRQRGLQSCQEQASIQHAPHIPGLASSLCVGTEVFPAPVELPYLSSRAQLTKNSWSDESEENPERTQGSHAEQRSVEL